MRELKFQIGDLKTIGVIFVVTALVLAFGLQILGDVQADMTAGSEEANATADGITAVGTFSGKLGIIATIVVAVVLIGLLLRYFGRV